MHGNTTKRRQADTEAGGRPESPCTIVFTGGGSAGHVTPNIALISRLREKGWDVHYIGSHDGIERQIISEIGVPYYPISSGKLRRYFDLNNLKDPFKVMRGLFQARSLLNKLKPDIIFSKGGFVAVPVVAAGKWSRIPVVIHESDMTPGLANRLSIPFASIICVTFPETLTGLPQSKAVHTGLPIREQIFTGNAERGFRKYTLIHSKPVLLVMGGSLGSRAINEAVRGQLDELTKTFQVLHICGKGNIDARYNDKSSYKQFEYVQEELPDLLAMSDLVVSRAGSTSLNEFLALKKPMLLIPLTLQASRGDQILNAQSFEAAGFCKVLPEENLSAAALLANAIDVYEHREQYIRQMDGRAHIDSLGRIVEIITEITARKN